MTDILIKYKKYFLLIPILIILAAFSIFPLGFFSVSRESSSLERGISISGTITQDTPIAGIFTPSHNKLSYMGFRFSVPKSDENTGTIRLIIRDQNESILCDMSIPIRELKNNQYYDFPVSLKLETNEPYVYELTSSGYGENAPAIYLGSPDIASTEHQSIFYNRQQLTGNAPVARYIYRTQASFQEALPYYILLVTLLTLTIPLWGGSKKKICTFFCVTLAAIFLILAADESKRPLILTGDQLRRDAGSIEGSTLVINADSNYSGKLAYTWNYMLSKGTYYLGVEYRTDTADNTLYVRDNGATALSFCLDPSYTYQEIPFTLSKDSQEVLIELYYNGTAALSINSIQLMPQERFYTDAVFFSILLMLGSIAALFFCRSSFFKQLPGESKMVGFTLLAIAAAASLPLMNGYLKWADDLCYHLIRIEGIKDGLLDGQLPVVIYPEGLHGNGYLNCMYPNLFLYFPAILRIFGVSMANSYKMLLVLFHILTAFLTYYSVKSLMSTCEIKDTIVVKKAALFATLLYTLCPYRFTNAYARGALGEFLAMTFLPLLLAGLYHTLLGNRKKYWMLILGLTGLIQTHVLSALIGFVFCLMCGLACVVCVVREKRFGVIFLSALLTVLLNIWFIVPFLYFYVKGNLWPSALDWCNFSEYSLNLSGLLGTVNPEDFRTLTLGLPIGFCAVFSLYSIIFERKKDRLYRYGFCLFVLGCISTLMVLNQFPGWPLMEIKMIEFLLKNIQFAWRMLGPASILFVMSGSLFLYRSTVAAPWRKGIVIALASITLLSISHFQPEDFAYANYYDTFTIGHESKLRGVPRGDNTIVYPYEWRPYGTLETDLSTVPVFSDSSVVTVHEFTKDGTTYSLNYSCAVPEQTVSMPIIHYAGYRAYDENGKELVLNTDPNNNTLQLSLIGDSQTHQIIVKYKGLVSFTLAFWVSIITFVICLLFFFFHVSSQRKKKDSRAHKSTVLTEIRSLKSTE